MLERAGYDEFWSRIYLLVDRLVKRSVDSYDVFLSHSFDDARLIVGVKRLLEEHALTVYVDWVDDALNRNNVTPETAAILRDRMHSCSVLIYAYSPNAVESRWMPWELGYFDGSNGKVAVVPVLETADETFTGVEFVGLYPYIDISGAVAWVNTEGQRVTLKRWVRAA